MAADKLTFEERQLVIATMEAVNMTIERDEDEAEDSDYAYKGNYQNFLFALSKEDYKLFLSALDKL